MRNKGRNGRAGAKPREKNDGKKRGRKPTYTTSSGQLVAKINLTPTTSSLADMIGRVLLVSNQANGLKEGNGSGTLTFFLHPHIKHPKKRKKMAKLGKSDNFEAIFISRAFVGAHTKIYFVNI